jgi:hypothetical protein
MDSEENKMKISDTPRTDDAEYLSYDSEPPQSLEMVDVGFARQLEIELNTAIANEAFAENKAYMLEKELKQAQDCIKRLEQLAEIRLAYLQLLEKNVDILKPRIEQLESFVNRFLDPEDLGYAVNHFLRDDAREALGMKRVES